MSGQRRFWRLAEVVSLPGGHGVALDGRTLRLPDGSALCCESLGLAEAVAAEWQQAGDRPDGMVSADDMVLTGLAGTLQRTPDLGATIERLTQNLRDELLCYRASRPQALVSREAALWQPWLDWAQAHHGIRLLVQHGVMPQAQPAASLLACRRLLESLRPATLVGLGFAAPRLGSLVLALALASGRLGAAEAQQLSRLGELFQAELWGADAASEACAASVGRELQQAARFMALSGAGLVGSGQAGGEMEMAERAGERWRIAGRVQGVGYRAWMVDEAARLGVAGWVRNRTDGTVEALVLGSAEALAGLRRSCERGPPLANVKEIAVTPAQHDDEAAPAGFVQVATHRPSE